MRKINGIGKFIAGVAIGCVLTLAMAAGCEVDARSQTDQSAGLVEVASQAVKTGSGRVWITIFRDEERQAWVYLAVASNHATNISVVPIADAGR